MVKWTAPEPYIGLSGSDSRLCVNFELCEVKSKQSKQHIGLQRQAINVDKKTSLHILGDGATCVQVGDIKQ
jgi:hypothetical protein